MLVAILLAITLLAPRNSATPLYNVEESKRDTDAADEEINHVEDVKTDPDTKTDNLKDNTITLDDEPYQGDERNGKKYFQHDKGFASHFYNFNRPYSNPRVIRPPVKFVSNGQPYNIVVNPREYLNSTPELTTSTPPPQTDSPLIWLTNTFLFNGRPTSVFSIPPHPSPWRSWPPVRGIPILQG